MTCRAIYILEKTLPEFFQVGLVSTIDPTRPDIVDVPLSETGSVESIYSPTIRLTYTPPVALPPPFPRSLSLDGLALYMTSSVFIRHTMKTFYSDLRVEMRKLAVHTPSSTASQTSPPGTTPSRRREKSVFVGLTVHGTTRVSDIDSLATVGMHFTFSLLFFFTLAVQPLVCLSSTPLPLSTMFSKALAILFAVPFVAQRTSFLRFIATLHLRCPSTVVSAQSCTRYYTVQSGDICDSISAANSVSTYQLAVVNNNIIDSSCDNLNPGSTICLGWQGEDCTTTYVVRLGDTCDGVAYNSGINTTVLYANNPQLTQDCTNLYVGEVICTSSTVEVPPVPGSGTIPGSAIPATATPAATDLPWCD
ncbi:hypothetical protein J3R83DRAFT_2852 [Lanmaoa asiatica]|nr:hypothetical protein J3R83DRAFT_2852 [Lanmaoa asiatica]